MIVKDESMMVALKEVNSNEAEPTEMKLSMIASPARLMILKYEIETGPNELIVMFPSKFACIAWPGIVMPLAKNRIQESVTVVDPELDN